MSSKARYLKISSTRKMTLPGEDSVETRFLLEKPYDWNETINVKLISDMTAEILDWKRRCLYSEEYFKNIDQESVESSVTCGIFCSSPAWYHAAPTNPKAYHKALLISKFFDIFFEIDDFCEEHEGKESHFEVVHLVGSMWARISSLRYTSADELMADPTFEAIISLNPTMGSVNLLFLDIMLELRDKMGMTRESGKYMSDCFKNSFGAGAWSGTNCIAYRYNSELQKFLRHASGGIYITAEMMFVLEGIQVPGVIRENYYWQRCKFLSAILLTRTNDIISIENEYKGQLRKGTPADNSVLLHMVSRNYSLKESIKKITKSLNLAVKEFQEMYDLVQSSPVLVSELTEDMKKVFYDSFEIMYRNPAYCIQGQCHMTRYRMTWRTDIEEEN